jgi:uncharacterized membrane protein
MVEVRMSTTGVAAPSSALTVLKFNTADGAEQMQHLLLDLTKQQLLQVRDAAIVSWPVGAKKPKTRQLHNLAGAGALDGAFWGLLFGLIFFVPLLGLAIGAGMGALMGSMTDIGIDDNFINQVRSQVTEGTSALFLLTSNVVLDRLAEEIKKRGLQFEIIATNLAQDREQKLREVFAADTAA